MKVESLSTKCWPHLKGGKGKQWIEERLSLTKVEYFTTKSEAALWNNGTLKLAHSYSRWKFKRSLPVPTYTAPFTILKIPSFLSICIPSVFTGQLFGSGCCGDTDDVEHDSHQPHPPRAPVLTRKADFQLSMKLTAEQDCETPCQKTRVLREYIKQNPAQASSVLKTTPFSPQKPNYLLVCTPLGGDLCKRQVSTCGSQMCP